MRLPEDRSLQRRTPRSQSANACIADVLPELFGPTKTTGLPRAISTSLNRLKLRTVSLVSTGYRSSRRCLRLKAGLCRRRTAIRNHCPKFQELIFPRLWVGAARWRCCDGPARLTRILRFHPASMGGWGVRLGIRRAMTPPRRGADPARGAPAFRTLDRDVPRVTDREDVGSGRDRRYRTRR